MNYLVTAPITTGMRGILAVNLGKVLSELLQHGIIKSYPPPNIPTADQLATLESDLSGEIASAVVADSMRQLVSLYQVQQGLGDHLHGVVEETTARSLNDMIRAYGLPLRNEPPPDLRTLLDFSVTFSNTTKKFHLRFLLDGETQKRTLSVSPTILSALLAMKSSAAHFVFDVKANSFVATDNLLQ